MPEPLVERQAWSVPEVTVSTGIGATTIWQAIASGDLKSIKIGRRRLVRPEAVDAWLASHEVGR